MNALIMFIVAMFVVIPYALAHGFSTSPPCFRFGHTLLRQCHAGNSDRVIYGSVSANNTEFDDFVGLFNGGGALNASAYFMGTYFLPDAVGFSSLKSFQLLLRMSHSYSPAHATSPTHTGPIRAY